MVGMIKNKQMGEVFQPFSKGYKNLGKTQKKTVSQGTMSGKSGIPKMGKWRLPLLSLPHPDKKQMFKATIGFKGNVL